MIDRIVVSGYRCFTNLEIQPRAGMNIIVGDNEASKSTLLEAVSLAITGKVNGRWASEELNPHWFHQATVQDFFDKYGTAQQVATPEIRIEVYLSNEPDLQVLRGVHNTKQLDCPGINMHIRLAADYAEDFDAYMADSPPQVLPVEFYEIDWRDFSDGHISRKPKEICTSFIDSRTIRSTSGVDYHTRELLSQHLDTRERVTLSLAHRKSRQNITDSTLREINERITEVNAALHNRPMGLQMDQSSRTSWELGIVPQVDDIPFAMIGQGQQATVKVALAMSRSTEKANLVLIEEPENHLSHTTLTQLVSRIEQLAGPGQQLFITTHNSFVLNRLGLDRLLLIHEGRTAKLSQLEADTVNYFRKLAGYDTLRLVLARRLVLVEGPSDVVIFERAFRDATGSMPADRGIDVMSMGGLTFKRALQVCACLDRQALALQDNDGRAIEDVTADVIDVLKDGRRELIVSDPEHGKTLEPQLIAANNDATLRGVLRLTERADLLTWMTNDKTEAAIRIFDSDVPITYPRYITDAVARLV